MDLWEDQDEQAKIMADRRSAPDRPSYFDENWQAAQENAERFANTNYMQNSRTAAINDRLNEIYEKTGTRITDPSIGMTSEEMVGGPNRQIESLRKTHPEIEPLDPKQIEEHAKIKSLEARQRVQALGEREQTWGGYAGGFLGGMYGGLKDPLTLATLGIAPSHTLGIVKTAIAWGTIAGTQRAVNEVANAVDRDNIDPGYIDSGEPYRGVIEAFGYGALWGAGPKVVANVWTRFRHGDWPTGIRDAGNHVLSEAQIDDTNSLSGAAGEAAHRQALAEAAGQLDRGEPIRVNLDPNIVQGSRDLMLRLEGEAPHTLPIPNEERLKLTTEAEGLSARHAELDRHLEDLPEGRPEAAETLMRVRQVERELDAATTAPERLALSRRRDELLTNTTPEKLAAEAAPIEQRRAAIAEQANIEARLTDIEAQIAKGRAKNLTLGDTIKQAMIGQTSEVRPGARSHWLAARMSAPARAALVQNTTPGALTKILQSPEHLKAIRHDLEMEATAHKIKEQTPEEAQLTTIGGKNIARPPARPGQQEPQITVGRPGEEVTKSLSEHLKDLDDLEKGANELESCYRPQAEQEAERVNP